MNKKIGNKWVNFIVGKLSMLFDYQRLTNKLGHRQKEEKGPKKTGQEYQMDFTLQICQTM